MREMYVYRPEHSIKMNQSDRRVDRSSTSYTFTDIDCLISLGSVWLLPFTLFASAMALSSASFFLQLDVSVSASASAV